MGREKEKGKIEKSAYKIRGKLEIMPHDFEWKWSLKKVMFEMLLVLFRN